MTDLIDEIQGQIGKAAEALKDIFFRLAGLVAGLPLSPQETSLDDIEGVPDRPTEIRSVTLGVMNDYLRPAVRDLLAVAEPRPNAPPSRDADFFKEFRRVFGIDLTVPDKRSAAAAKGSREGRDARRRASGTWVAPPPRMGRAGAGSSASVASADQPGGPMALKLKPVAQQVIVITGASSGIGLATAEAAAAQGARLALAARSERTLRELAGRINADGGEAIYVVADVSDRAQVEKIAEAAIDRFGRIDTWINDAAVSIYGRLDEVSEADGRRLFDVNFWGVVYGSLVALPHLKRQGGALINVGSEVSESVVPLQGMYTASKHAVKGFTDALRVEIEEVDEAPVAITLIQPTAVDTPFPQHARNYMDREPKLPTPQIEPEKVAEAILDAAAEPARDVKVGMVANLNVTTAKLAPSLGDKMAAMQAGRQQHDLPPLDPEGTLYKPGEEGRKHGRKPVEMQVPEEVEA
jgi:short-subunit dehydrogenase